MRVVCGGKRNTCSGFCSSSERYSSNTTSRMATTSESHPADEPLQPSRRTEELFRSFRFEKVINEDPSHHTINLLGTIEKPTEGETQATESLGTKAIVIINKTHFSNELETVRLLNSPDLIKRVQVIGENDVYHWSLGWFNEARKSIDQTPDHIQKYSKQVNKIIRETPELYLQIVLPYIQQIPPARLSWLYNILDHMTESDKIVYENPSHTDGFIIMPDLKWDQTTLSSLYLLCIVRDRQIHSLRDLRPKHIGLLKSIRLKAFESIEKKYKVHKRELRMFVHYQPSYYHFHVHITHVNHIGFQGCTVGQAHLLDEIIDNLEFELELQLSNPNYQKKSFYQSKTLVYGLGSNHDLFQGLWAHQQV